MDIEVETNLEGVLERYDTELKDDYRDRLEGNIEEKFEDLTLDDMFELDMIHTLEQVRDGYVIVEGDRENGQVFIKYLQV